MPSTPGVLGRRYAPLLALAAVQVLLVAVAPSTVKHSSTAAGDGSSQLTAGSGDTSGATDAAGATATADGSVDPASGGQASGIAGGGGGASAGSGTGTATGG